MAGGTWVTQNKVRPGVYVNFKGEPNTNVSVGDRGVLAVVTSDGWGPFNTVREVLSSDWAQRSQEFTGKFASNDDPYTMAMSKVNKMYFVRLGGASSVKATITAGGVKADALYGGTIGNTFAVEVSASLQNVGSFYVNTYVGNALVDSQLVSIGTDLVANDFVSFTVQSSISQVSKTSLAGGTNVVATSADFGNALTALEAYNFNLIAVPTADASQKALATAYAIRNFEEAGKYFQVVLADYPTADNEHVVSVKNGLVVGETLITKEQATVVYAGYRAGANINQSLTYTAIEGVTDANPRLSNADTEVAILAGEIVFTFDIDRVIVETDINSLKTLGQDKNDAFKKNRVIAVLQAVATDLPAQFRRQFIGKVDANKNGLDLVKSAVTSYMNNLENINAIQNFDSSTDVTVSFGQQTDSILITIWIQPVDSIEKIYMSVEVK